MRTLIIVKPDWVENSSFLAELFHKIKEYDLSIVFFRKISFKENFWREFYTDHVGTHYFEEMVQWMASSPSIFVVLDGEKAIEVVRWQIIGRNDSGLRGKYQTNELRNVAHASDSEKSAAREIDLVYQSSK